MISLLTWGIPATYVFYFQNSFFSYEYPMWKNAEDLARGDLKLEQDPALLVIGDSRAKAAFRPDLLSPSGYSLALGGSTPIDGYFLFRDYLRNHPAPKILILSYAPIHYEYSDWFWERSVKWNMVSISEGLEVLDHTRNNHDWLGYIPWRHAESDSLDARRHLVLMKLNFFQYYQGDFWGGRFYQRKEENLNRYENLVADHGWSHFGMDPKSTGLTEETSRQHFTEAKTIRLYLDRMVELAEKNRVNVYFVTVPIPKRSFSQISPEYKSEYHAYMKELSSKYPNARTLGELRGWNDSEFGDVSHMMPEASIRFSKELSSAIH